MPFLYYFEITSIQNRELLCEFSSHRNIDLCKAEVAAL